MTTIAPGSQVKPVRLWRCGACDRLFRWSVAPTHQQLAHGGAAGGAVRIWSVVSSSTAAHIEVAP